MLVQGAGGNVSWKEGNALWIKASGTWLADAESSDIFVPVDLSSLQKGIASRNFNVKPATLCNTSLRPSIETLLHAVMPHRVVAHLHAIDVLAWVVRRSFADEVATRLAGVCEWTWVDYSKPGPELAHAVHRELAIRPESNIVLLGNHGIIAGADSTEDLSRLYERVLFALKCPEIVPMAAESHPAVPPWILATGYRTEYDPDIAALAYNALLLDRLQRDWALYPDHVVFLGEQPAIHNAHRDHESVPALSEQYGYMIVPHIGVFTRPDFNKNQRAMLKCFSQLARRLPADIHPRTLCRRDIGELLNWDAERYRQSIAR
ncbi:class II aldolase/adducin family protein [Cupriavidus basilensis]|uniref:class II aldolase/adducin family protein n=1 Tax=Cupriavidus basilensis TaxID=68895 RepID=UPI0023E89F24|nr:class II aldolase/adducin family protein [Cupriavidus basilensis]MDF3886540.1 class II aldolase/adducin family protein [Cupriavidus basilensis]